MSWTSSESLVYVQFTPCIQEEWRSGRRVVENEGENFLPEGEGATWDSGSHYESKQNNFFNSKKLKNFTNWYLKNSEGLSKLRKASFILLPLLLATLHFYKRFTKITRPKSV